mmetsp:Transcript_19199/g.55831  ORF Transcript_19199/g.55831 Transcript_19199/m.55831 type:complete len:261 (+) Transcript_19199:338-1120(+)
MVEIQSMRAWCAWNTSMKPSQTLLSCSPRTPSRVPRSRSGQTLFRRRCSSWRAHFDYSFILCPQLTDGAPLPGCIPASQVISTYYRLLMSQSGEARDTAKTQILAALETVCLAMAPLSEGPFFMGSQFGLFEVAFLPWCQRFFSVLHEYRGFCLPDTPAMQRLEKWYEACCQRTSYAATVVDRERLIQNNSGYADNTATSTVAQNTRAGGGAVTAATVSKSNQAGQARDTVPVSFALSALVLGVAAGVLVTAATMIRRCR